MINPNLKKSCERCGVTKPISEMVMYVWGRGVKYKMDLLCRECTDWVNESIERRDDESGVSNASQPEA